MNDVKIILAGATLVVSALKIIVQHRTQIGKEKKKNDRK